MQPFLRKRGTGRRGSPSRIQPVARTPTPAPANSSGRPLPVETLHARRTAASAAEGEARRRLARVASLCPELLPLLSPLPHRRGRGGGKGAEMHTEKGCFLSFSPRLITPPPPAEEKHFQALPAHTGITFASPEEPGGHSGSECASAAPATSYLVVGGLPGGGVVVKEGGEASVF